MGLAVFFGVLGAGIALMFALVSMKIGSILMREYRDFRFEQPFKYRIGTLLFVLGAGGAAVTLVGLFYFVASAVNF